MNYKKLLPLLIIVLALIFFMIMKLQAPKSDHVLRVWQSEMDMDAREVLNEMVSEFEKMHPGIKVEVESVSWGSLSSKLGTVIKSRNEPDLSHVQPFMVNSLRERGLLVPMNGLIREIEIQSGEIYESLKSLQSFSGVNYGIAYAVGTTSYAYRKDLFSSDFDNQVLSWNQFLNEVKRTHATSGLRILLPGGSPFFIDQLVGELIANSGGSIFDENGNPELEESLTIALSFLSDLKPYIHEDWSSITYLEQFAKIARGEVSLVMVTYGRASKSIENSVVDLEANDSIFGLLDQPVYDINKQASIATIDAEPFVIFSRAEEREFNGKTNVFYAQEFLKLFYSSPYYVKFCSSVPIHLTPIFPEMATNSAYSSTIQEDSWTQWNSIVINHLENQNVRPILMPSDNASTVKYLLEFSARNILTTAVVNVLINDMSPVEAAKSAQISAEKLWNEMK